MCVCVCWAHGVQWRGASRREREGKDQQTHQHFIMVSELSHTHNWIVDLSRNKWISLENLSNRDIRHLHIGAVHLYKFNACIS